ncbi:hypothetical protein HPP92_021885 [Vanilla planifolia]|uniref:Uncharacterized protein n=1 Tax=Vanilla planifolia TaxID=51239 RepID=A0A835PZH9_VANPL|nr:hypothetical protein HPP92_021885 [Vanilla planifolia]
MLLHGATSSRIYALHVLCAVSIRKRHCGGEPDDGHSQFGSQLSYGLPKDIPKPIWRYPMSYISFHYWALQGQYKNDLKGLLFDGQSPYDIKIPGDYVLEHVFQIDVRRSKWCDLAVLFSMIAVYRVVFFAMIKISEEVTPWMSGSIARRRLMQKQRFRASVQLEERTPSLRAYVQETDAAGYSVSMA